MTTLGSQWDPEAVLGIGQVSTGVTCVGYAHSKNRRCNEPIAAANRQQATQLLHQLALIDVSSLRTVSTLEPLGRLLLCTEHHQNQLPHVTEQWRNKIEGHRIERAAVREAVAIIARFAEATARGDMARVQETMGLVQQMEEGLQARLAPLIGSNEGLKREMESLRTQLAALTDEWTRTRAATPTLCERVGNFLLATVSFCARRL